MLQASLARLSDHRSHRSQEAFRDIIVYLPLFLLIPLSNTLCPNQDAFGAKETARLMLVAQKILQPKNLWRTLNARFTLFPKDNWGYSKKIFMEDYFQIVQDVLQIRLTKAFSFVGG